MQTVFCGLQRAPCIALHANGLIAARRRRVVNTFGPSDERDARLSADDVLWTRLVHQASVMPACAQTTCCEHVWSVRRAWCPPARRRRVVNRFGPSGERDARLRADEVLWTGLVRQASVMPACVALTSRSSTNRRKKTKPNWTNWHWLIVFPFAF